MTDSTTTHDAQHDLPLPDYDARSALYNRLADETTTRNKATVFDALAKAGILIVTINFDGCSDSGQVEDVQANTQMTGRASVRPDRIRAYPLGRDRTHTKVLLAPRCPRRSCLPLPEYNPRRLGKRRRRLWRIHLRYHHPLDCLAYNDRFTDSIYSEHEF